MSSSFSPADASEIMGIIREKHMSRAIKGNLCTHCIQISVKSHLRNDIVVYFLIHVSWDNYSDNHFYIFNDNRELVYHINDNYSFERGDFGRVNRIRDRFVPILSLQKEIIFPTKYDDSDSTEYYLDCVKDEFSNLLEEHRQTKDCVFIKSFMTEEE